MRKWTIYKLTSPSGRIYIGKTCNFKERMYYYKRGFCKSQRLLHYSLGKYGFDSHALDILEEFENVLSLANEKEKYWILFYKTNRYKYPQQKGLNLTDGGDGIVGVKYTEERREKLSKYQKENPNSGQFKKGSIPWSTGTKGLIKAWNKGVIGLQSHPMKGKKYELSEEKRYERFVKPHLGKPSWNLGKKMPKEGVEKMAASKRGKSNYKVMVSVNKYDLKGNFIKAYDSLKDASIDTGILVSLICRNARGETKRCHSFIFKYNTGFEKQTFQRRIFKQQEIKTA